MAWNQREDMKDRFRIALGSFIEEYNNKVQVGRGVAGAACMLLGGVYSVWVGGVERGRVVHQDGRLPAPATHTSHPSLPSIVC